MLARAPPTTKPPPRPSNPQDDPFGLLGGLDLALPPRGAAGPGEDPAPRPEACAQCGGPLHREVSGLGQVCVDCGLIVEGDSAEPEEDEGARPAPYAARLRIVGANSSQLQPDLYRSGAGNTAAAQKRAVAEEYRYYRERYIERNGRAFPLNACDNAADLYNAVQRNCVKRSKNKKMIMAACLYHACVQIGFVPPRAELAALMQLPGQGIARGDNFIRGLVADGKMEVDVHADPRGAEIATLFVYLGLEGDRYAGLRAAVEDVVATMIGNNIGTSSVLRSKVAGAAYEVLRRCRDPALLPAPLSMQEFCRKREIRKNTLERVLRGLADYHSFFEPVYRRAGLEASPGRGRPPAPDRNRPRR